MSISIYRQDNDFAYNLKKFILDSPSDLEILTTNCAPGSSAFIISNSQLYMLNNQKQWTLIPEQTSGGGSEGIYILNLYINSSGELICELSNGTTINAGKIPTTNITLINGGNASTIF